MDIEIEVFEEVLRQDGEMLAELGWVLGGGKDDEGKERGVGGGMWRDGEEGRARVLLWRAQDVMCGTDGEIARCGGGEVAELVGGGGARGDEVELGLEVREEDGGGLREGVHVHRCFGGKDAGGEGRVLTLRCRIEVAVEINAGWGTDKDVDVEGVADGFGGEVELSSHVAVDNGSDERNGVVVIAEERNT